MIMTENNVKKCKHCGALLGYRQNVFCSHKCEHEFTKGKTWEEMYGLERANKIRELFHQKRAGKPLGNKVPRETRICPICNTSFICMVNKSTKFCSRKCSIEFQRGKSLEERYGPERAKLIVKQMLITMKANPINKVGIHYKEILNQAKILEKEGFRCIPIGKVVPDIIAIKDGKIFAIEVEKGNPNWDKYTDEIRKFFDDIIWVLLRKEEREIVKVGEIENE